MPGDSPTAFRLRLNKSGADVIRNFIAHGGSYFGVCGAGMYANKPLKLFNGSVAWTLPELEMPGIAQLAINTSCGIDLSGIPSTLNTLYYGGGYYLPNEGQEMITLARYYNNRSAIIEFHYGTGCVCLSGPHPEYEENSDRDGTDYMDEHNDPDSEWDFMLKIALWQVEESIWVTPTPSETTSTTTSTNTTTTTTSTEPVVIGPLLVSLAVAGGLGVVLVVLIIIKNR
jgi:hypothetical protein